MAVYKVFCRTAVGKFVSLHYIHAAHDQDAINQASKIDGSTIREVWQRERLVRRLNYEEAGSRIH